MTKIRKLLAILMVILSILALAGCSEGWTEPPEEESNGDIILSGQKWSGKVVVKVTLHPDGTGEHEGNGDVSPATWEKGTGDVAMVVHFTVKGTDYTMNVMDAGDIYTADYPIVAELPLTGSKDGSALPEQTEPVTEEATQASEAETEAPTENTAPAAEAPSYPDNTYVLSFVADINEQLTGTFSCEPAIWQAAFGDSDSYTPTDSEDILFTWTPSGKSKELDFFANGTYEFRYSKMGIAEQGTWTFQNGVISLLSEGGKEMIAEKIQAAAEEPASSDDTYTLSFVADINEQLTGSFSCEPAIWKAAFGDSDSYTPTDSEDILFTWTPSGKSKELDFFANGTYEFRYSKMGIAEHGTWTFQDGVITLLSEGGKEMVAEKAAG